MNASPLVRLSRRQRVRMADSVIAGVSSISSGSEPMSRLTWTNLSKSFWPISPRRMRSPDTRASSESSRIASCSELISSEKIATVPFGLASGSMARAASSRLLAAPNAILVASAVLPMPGRPARISRSDGCSPPVLMSKSRSPVDRPATPPGLLKARSAPWMATVSAFSNVTKPPPVEPSLARSNSDCSANSICCAPFSSASAPNALLTTTSPISISWRRSQASWMARPYSPALMMPTMADSNCAR